MTRVGLPSSSLWSHFGCVFHCHRASLYSWISQIDLRVFPLSYNTNMDTNQISTLYTISFSNPRLHPDSQGDFCVYFALETQGAETLVTNLALFIRSVRRKLIRWSVLGHPDCLRPGNPIHLILRDLACCWDGVATAYGVLQLGTPPVAVMNIQWAFHRTTLICTPFCHAHWYEYFATGIFLDVEWRTLPLVFDEMESAARYASFAQFHLIFKFLIHGSLSGSCVMTTTSLSTLWIMLGVSRSKV